MKQQLFYTVIFCFLLINSARAEEKYQWNSLPVGGAGFVTGIIT